MCCVRFRAIVRSRRFDRRPRTSYTQGVPASRPRRTTGKPCSRFGFAAASGFQEPVSNLINERIALTLVISRYFPIFTCAVFIPVGIIVSAVKQYSLTDYTVTLHGFPRGLATRNLLRALLLM